MKPSQIALKAVKILSKRGAWIQHGSAESKEGDYRNPGDEDAVRFCAVGALNHIAGKKRSRPVVRAAEKILLSRKDGGTVINYNDTPHRKKKQVLDLLRQTAKALKSKGR